MPRASSSSEAWSRRRVLAALGLLLLAPAKALAHHRPAHSLSKRRKSLRVEVTRVGMARPGIPVLQIGSPAGVTGNLQTHINNATAGDTINYADTHTGNVTVNKALTIIGGAVNGLVTISASNVTLRDMTIERGQHSSFVSGQNCIYASGVNDVTLDGMSVGDCGDSGIRLNNVTRYTITNPNIYDCVYTGIITTSGHDGLIDGGEVRRIGVLTQATDGNAYGITLTRFTTSDPKSSDSIVRNVTVADVPTWHGLDTHGGDSLIFEDNIITGCYRGIMVTGFDGINNLIQRNHISATSQPSSGRGILVSGNTTYRVNDNTVVGPIPVGLQVQSGSCGSYSGNTFTNVTSPIVDSGTAC